MKWKRRRRQRQKIAYRHISRLFDLARAYVQDNPARARRYIEMARLISRKHKVTFSKEQKRSYCKACNLPLVPGVSSRVRVEHGMVSITCLDCGHVKRYPYRKERHLSRTPRRGYAEMKVQGGLICVDVTLEGRAIKAIEISGDFFIYPEEMLPALEQRLLHVQTFRIQEVIHEFFDSEGVKAPGMTPDDLARAIERAVGGASPFRSSTSLS